MAVTRVVDRERRAVVVEADREGPVRRVGRLARVGDVVAGDDLEAGLGPAEVGQRQAVRARGRQPVREVDLLHHVGLVRRDDDLADGLAVEGDGDPPGAVAAEGLAGRRRSGP